MDTAQTGKQSFFKSNRFWIVVTALNTLVILFAIGYSFFRSFSDDQESEKITINNITSEQAQQLSEKLVYTGVRGEKDKYYSPTLDLLVDYDSTKYTFSEAPNYVTVLPNNSGVYPLYATIRFLQKPANDPISHYSSLYEKDYDDVKREEQGTAEGLPFARISYSQIDPYDKAKRLKVYKYIVYREFEDMYLLSEVTYPSGYSVTAVGSDIALVLQSAEISPDIDDGVDVALQESGLKFSYQRNMWEGSIYGYTANLRFRAKDFETDEDLRKEYSLSELKISGMPLIEGYDLKPLESIHLESRQLYEESYEGFKETKKLYDIEVNNVKYLVSEFEYNSILDEISYATLYTGYSEDLRTQIEILLRVEKRDSVATSEAEKIIKTLVARGYSLESKSVNETPSENILGTASIEIQKAAIVARPAVVHIYNRTCASVKVGQSPLLPNSSGKSYDPMCVAGTGSGFFITSDGYLVTNGHVATPLFIDTPVAYLLHIQNTSEFWKDFLGDIVSILTETGVAIDQMDANELTNVVVRAYYNLFEQGVLEVEGNHENYVEQDLPISLDAELKLLSPTSFLRAEVIEGDVSSNYNTESGITIPDLALLKVEPPEGVQFPTLQLRDPLTITTGERISAIGFPGAVQSNYLFSARANMVPTITNGTITAIKPSANETFKLLQIDASISGGNSGGPIVDSNGRVVGVSTYKINTQDTGEYNAGVSVEEVIKLLENNQIAAETSEVTGEIILGVSNFEKQYYALASSNFTTARQLYPLSTDLLEPLITISNDRVSNGEDRTPIFALLQFENLLTDLGLPVWSTTTIAILIGMSGLFISLLVLSLLSIRKKILARRSKPVVVGNPEVYIAQEQTAMPLQATTHEQQKETTDQSIQVEQTQPTPESQGTNSIDTFAPPIQTDSPINEGTQPQNTPTQI